MRAETVQRGSQQGYDPIDGKALGLRFEKKPQSARMCLGMRDTHPGPDGNTVNSELDGPAGILNRAAGELRRDALFTDFFALPHEGSVGKGQPDRDVGPVARHPVFEPVHLLCPPGASPAAAWRSLRRTRAAGSGHRAYSSTE